MSEANKRYTLNGQFVIYDVQEGRDVQFFLGFEDNPKQLLETDAIDEARALGESVAVAVRSVVDRGGWD